MVYPFKTPRRNSVQLAIAVIATVGLALTAFYYGGTGESGMMWNFIIAASLAADWIAQLHIERGVLKGTLNAARWERSTDHYRREMLSMVLLCVLIMIGSLLYHNYKVTLMYAIFGIAAAWRSRGWWQQSEQLLRVQFLISD